MKSRGLANDAIQILEWKEAIKRLESVVEVVKPIKLVSYGEATSDGSMDIWNAFRT
jgi:hypothetical protein